LIKSKPYTKTQGRREKKKKKARKRRRIGCQSYLTGPLPPRATLKGKPRQDNFNVQRVEEVICASLFFV
jgi:hypothetical protein